MEQKKRMYAGHSLIMGNVGYNLLANILCRREEDLSAPRAFVVCSESVVSLFHLVH